MANLGERNRQATAISRGQTLRNEYTRAQYIPTALGQASYLAQSLQRQERTAEASKKLYEAMAEIDRNNQLYPTAESKKIAKENLITASKAYQPETGSSYDEIFK